MKKHTKITWIADDGTEFDKRESCEAYENSHPHKYEVTIHQILEFTITVPADNEDDASSIALDAVNNSYDDEWNEISMSVNSIKQIT